MEINYLVIEGNIGAGKTTLAGMIAQKYQARLILERFADNPFLPQFYSNPERFSFPLELSFLADRYNQLVKELPHQDLFAPMTVSDYYFQKSLIFAQNTLQPDEFNLYRQLFQIIYPSLPKPNLMVYLHLPVDAIQKNIQKRGRDYEKSISSDYLESISRGYFDFFRQNPDLPVLVVETAGLDFVERERDFEALCSLIFSQTYPPGMTIVKPGDNPAF